jgi:FtsH-binding integral membrane protein
LDARQWLLGFSVALGLLEIADGFRLELPWMAWAFAALLLGGAIWLWRSPSRAPVWFLGTLHLLELLLLLFVFRTAAEAPPTALFIAFVAVALGGAAASVLVLTRNRPG